MNLREYFLRARKLARLLMLQKKTAELRKRLAALASKTGVSKSTLKKAATIEVNKKKDDFVNAKVFVNLLSGNYNNIKTGFDSKVFETVRRGLQKGDSVDAIESRLRDTQAVQERHIGTVQNTIELGLNRAGSMAQSIKNGGKYFKYVGPSMGARPFCLRHLNKTYTLAEIRAMDNGQGLPVEHFCGGYNCTHRWVEVSEAEYLAYLERNAA